MSPKAAVAVVMLAGGYLVTGWAPCWWALIGTVLVDFVEYLRNV